MIFFMLPCLQNNIICFILLSLKFLMKTYGKLHQMFICSLLIVVSWEIHWMFLFRSLCKLKKNDPFYHWGPFILHLHCEFWYEFHFEYTHIYSCTLHVKFAFVWIYTHLLMHTACQVCLYNNFSWLL